MWIPLKDTKVRERYNCICFFIDLSVRLNYRSSRPISSLVFTSAIRPRYILMYLTINYKDRIPLMEILAVVYHTLRI